MLMRVSLVAIVVMVNVVIHPATDVAYAADVLLQLLPNSAALVVGTTATGCKAPVRSQISTVAARALIFFIAAPKLLVSFSGDDGEGVI